MANFSANQVRQFYVATKYSDEVTADSPTGTIGGFKTVEDVLGPQVIFFYKGADTVLKSDYIPVYNVSYAQMYLAEQMATKMRKISLTLADNVISGQDYVLGINFKGFFSPGDGNQYYKHAAVLGTQGMTKAQFAQKMVDSLNAAFSREDGATKTSNPYLKFTVDGEKIIIEEKPQAWERGTKKARRIYFDVFPGTVYDGTQDVHWAAVNAETGQYFTEETRTTIIGNGQQIADLEWFCAGERGDQYRMVGWPHVINTTYLVDPAKRYHVLELHYAFTDTGVNSYRTEKEIHIAVPVGKEEALDAIIRAFERKEIGIDLPDSSEVQSTQSLKSPISNTVLGQELSETAEPTETADA